MSYLNSTNNSHAIWVFSIKIKFVMTLNLMIIMKKYIVDPSDSFSQIDFIVGGLRCWSDSEGVKLGEYYWLLLIKLF